MDCWTRLVYTINLIFDLNYGVPMRSACELYIVNRKKQHIRFRVLVKWRKNSKLISIVMAISIILNEFTDQKLLENLHFSWDRVSIMLSSMLSIKPDKRNRPDFIIMTQIFSSNHVRKI